MERHCCLFLLDHFLLVFHHSDFLDHNSLSLTHTPPFFPRSRVLSSSLRANLLEVASSIYSNHAIMLGVK